jgi:Flp pilus assembly protein TadD
VALLLNMKLGVVRDWDLLAAHASVVTLAAFAASRAAALPSAVIGVVWLASVGLNLPWFVVNVVPDAARSRLVAVTADLPAYPRALAFEDLGQQARDTGDLERSVEAYRMAAVACPQHARFHVLHGQALFRLSEYQLAIGPLRHALSLDPDNLLTHRMLLMSLTRLQRPEAALPHARALAGTHQEDWQVARAHGALAEQVGTPDEAMEAYLRAWKLAPERTELAVRSGELGLVAGRVEWAEQVFRRVLARDPGHGQARLGLARSLWSQVVAVALPDLERLGEVDRLLTDVAVPEAEATQVASWRDDVRERLRLAAAGD